MRAGTEQRRLVFRDEVCLPRLQESQNQDGGWGYRLRSVSRTEPTSWALITLGNIPRSNSSKEILNHGTEWLLSAQLADGSWPSHPDERQGDWCTSPALLALCSQVPDSTAIRRGLDWLLRTWPAEGGLWWRLRKRLQHGSSPVRQNFALRGWNWTPRTSSWVEPTSLALLALQLDHQTSSFHRFLRRRDLAEAMLFDRMCPGGGWNAGNPLVYGVPGDPAVSPTVWALLALRHASSRAEVIQSLDWLESVHGSILGPGSIALSHICLETFGRSTEVVEGRLQTCYEANEFMGDTLAFAWAALALTPRRAWPPGIVEGEQ